MDEPFFLTREQSRCVDAIAIERYGIPGAVLMENAGRGVVDMLLELDPALKREGKVVDDPASCSPLPNPPHRGEGTGRVFTQESVVILCGKGNNAGDGFVVARHLAIRGVAAKVLLAFPPDQLMGDARTNYEILTHCGAPIAELPHEGLVDALDRHAGSAAWLVDALLGTGATGEPREPLPSIIAWMNAQAARRLAVDVPSGLDCDTGQASAATVRADVTCTFVAAKVGLVVPQAKPFVGELRVVSIGVPAGVIREAMGR